jgi:hypothetical protein
LAARETKAGVEALGGGKGGAPSAARRTRAVRGEGGEAGTGLEKTDCCGSGGGGGGDPALFCGT